VNGADGTGRKTDERLDLPRCSLADAYVAGDAPRREALRETLAGTQCRHGKLIDGDRRSTRERRRRNRILAGPGTRQVRVNDVRTERPDRANVRDQAAPVVTTRGGRNDNSGGVWTTERHPLDDRTADTEEADLDFRAEESEEVGETEIGPAELAVVGVGEQT
jgi:hypothetical protein